MDGIDVSNHQGPSIDWSAVAQAGKSFAFIKASEDPDFRDPHFSRNWQQSKAARLVRGAYHFARPSESSPAASVTLLQQMLQSVGGAQPGDMIALDIEDTNVPANQNLSQWVSEWLALAEQALGVKPLIYSGHWYMEPHGLLNPALGQYPLWYASYQPNPPPAPTGWQTISIWQHSSSGTVPGIPGDCDLNRFFGTAADLAQLGKAAPVAPPNSVYEANAWGPIFQASQFLFGTGNQGDAEDANDLLTLLTRNKARHGA